MDRRDLLAAPDEHLDPAVAERYDESIGDMATPSRIMPTVDLLAELAGDGVAVEFAIGTGRIALPFAERGIEVRGIDVSPAMLQQLRRRRGAAALTAVQGDMTTARVARDASLVYLVFNSIMNLRTSEAQAACFVNAAAHLAPGGRFVIETAVPRWRDGPPGDPYRAFDLTASHVGYDELVDAGLQISVSHHWFFVDGEVRTTSGAFRFVYPDELDAMALDAGLELEDRWADWQRNAFDAASTSHVSVWHKPGS